MIDRLFVECAEIPIFTVSIYEDVCNQFIDRCGHRVSGASDLCGSDPKRLSPIIRIDDILHVIDPECFADWIDFSKNFCMFSLQIFVI